MIYLVIITFVIVLSFLLFYLLIYRNRYKQIKLFDQNIATGLNYNSYSIKTKGWDNVVIFGIIESTNVGNTKIILEGSYDNTNWVIIEEKVLGIVNNNNTTYYVPDVAPDIGFIKIYIESDVNAKVSFYAILKEK